MDLFHFWAPRLPQRILWHLLWLNGCIETRPKYFQITAKKSSQEDAVGCKNKKQQDEIELKKMWSILQRVKTGDSTQQQFVLFQKLQA